MLTQYSFIVYAASAIYIIGIPDVIREFKIEEQSALLGLSLYVLACEFAFAQLILFAHGF